MWKLKYKKDYPKINSAKVQHATSPTCNMQHATSLIQIQIWIQKIIPETSIVRIYMEIITITETKSSRICDWNCIWYIWLRQFGMIDQNMEVVRLCISKVQALTKGKTFTEISGSQTFRPLLTNLGWGGEEGASGKEVISENKFSI